MATKKKHRYFDLKWIVFVGAAGLLLLIFYIFLRVQSTGKDFISISILCLLAGVLFEGKRLLGKWSMLFFITMIAFAFSFLTLLPGKHETHYNLDSHLRSMPYWFIFLFATLCITFAKDKITVRLTEGITLLQSVAMIYWVIDLHIYETTGFFVKVLMLIGAVFSIITLFHAFSPTTLSSKSRLTLSIWSCFIMLIFAADSIYQLYQNKPIESTPDVPLGFLVGLQFFILGVSTIYIVQNLYMLIGFLPGKQSFFNEAYYKELKELKNDHISRYSPDQVSVFKSFFCIFIAGGFFYLNYTYRFLPRQFAIWTVFILFPYLILPIDRWLAPAKKNDQA